MSQRNKSSRNNKSILRHRKSSKTMNNNNDNKNKSKSSSSNNGECPFNCDCCKLFDRKRIFFYKQYIINNIYSTSPYRLRNFHFLIDLILFGIGALYVVFVPYTKVEESFNMQATHDMLFYGYIDLESYDHFEFPGVVPRTFIGALLVSWMVWPWKLIVTFILPIFLPIGAEIHLQQQCQYLIRFALLFINIAALSKFRQSFIFAHFVEEIDTNRIYKYSMNNNKNNNNNNNHIKISMIQRFSLLFSLLVIAQFHFLFYSSRLLPNCFALPCVTIAFAEYFRNNYNVTLIWLAVSSIFFRCDTIVIAFPFILIMLLRGYQRFLSRFCGFFIIFIIYGIIASILCIGFTVFIDSWFWTGFTSFKWPEFEVLWYNTYNNKSSNWGISPWRYYFFPLIPKMLLINSFFMIFSIFKIYPMLLINELKHRYFLCNKNRSISPSNSPSSSPSHSPQDMKQNDNDFEYNENMALWRLILLFIDWESVSLIFICFFFVFLYSFLPHKETRFIFFIIPPCTLLSSIGCIRLLTLWGFRGFANASFNLLWFKQNLYERQKQLYYVWIPHDLLISSIVKKLVSLETPITFISLRRYLKVIIKDIPIEIYQSFKINIKKIKNNNNNINKQRRNRFYTVCYDCFANLIIPLFIFGCIAISTYIAWYGVYEASYNYPGGVAITLFPKIVRNYKTNITRYDHNVYAQYNDNYYYEEYDEFTSDEYENNNHHNDFDENIHRKKRKNSHSIKGDRMNKDYKNIVNASKSNNTVNKIKEYNYQQNKSGYNINNGNNIKILFPNKNQNEYLNINNKQNEIFELYDEINCVHIGNLAAISGVTRFMTPSFDREFRFSKTESVSIEEYAYLKDPCHLYQEMYSKMCTQSSINNNIHNMENQNKWKDEIYDEEYFEERDNYLNDGNDGNDGNDANNNNNNNNTDDCYSSIDYRYPTIQGFDYLITEHSSVPGYYLLPHGIIYAKSLSEKSSTSNMINYFLSFFVVNRNNDFLEPALYVLKRETQFVDH